MTYDSTNHHDNWGILGIRLKIKFGKSAMILSSPTDHMNPYDTSVSAWKCGKQDWLVVWTPLKNMSSSVGMIIPNWMET